MVDVDRRTTPGGLTPSHAAGLRRLSSRASNLSSTAPRLAGLHSFGPLASSLATSLKSSGVPLSPGLTEPELARIEAHFGLTFPPDLRALLSLSLPSSPGFPNWRSSRLPSLRPLIDLPIAAVSLQIAANSFWPKSWGPRPAHPSAALRRARSSLKRAPLLIPIFHRCYIPSLPSLAGNPVFFVDDHQISLCGLDLADFFSRFLRSPHILTTRSNSLPRGVDYLPKNPRWIELLLKADRCSDSLSRAGWSSEEVSDVLGFDFSLENGRKKMAEVKLPAEIRIKIGKLPAEIIINSLTMLGMVCGQSFNAERPWGIPESSSKMCRAR